MSACMCTCPCPVQDRAGIDKGGLKCTRQLALPRVTAFWLRPSKNLGLTKHCHLMKVYPSRCTGTCWLIYNSHILGHGVCFPLVHQALQMSRVGLVGRATSDYYYFLFNDLRERGRKRERERGGGDIDLLFHLLMHSLGDS